MVVKRKNQMVKQLDESKTPTIDGCEFTDLTDGYDDRVLDDDNESYYDA